MAKKDKKDSVDSHDASMHWYIIQIATGYEKKVIRALKDRIAIKGMEAMFGEVLVPSEEVVEMKDGQKRQTKKQFFPGYLLLQMILTDETWYLINGLANVRGFVGGSREKPIPLTETEISDIFSRVEKGVGKPRPKVVFEIGEIVRIIEGPFSDFNAVVEDVNFGKSKLRVSVLIFGRSTPVELEFSQVEKSHEI